MKSKYEQEELYHHGILGQKWGIRRYQNFDGTLTKAGLERYRDSEKTYEKRKEQYKSIKNDPSASSYNKQLAKAKMQEAKRDMNKRYKNLKIYKQADKGKVLYEKGYRITNSWSHTQTLAKLASAVAIGAEYAERNGYINTRTARIAQYASAGATALSAIKSVLDEIPNSKLRAYYAHPSTRK